MTRRRRLWAWGAAWVVASALLLLSLRSVDWQAALAAVSHARLGWLVAATAVNLSIVAMWGWQWCLFLPSGALVPYPRMLRVAAVMAMTANSVPYGAGHLTGLHLLATRGGTGHATALSVVTLDQASEGLAKVTLLVVVALLTPAPEALRGALLVLAPAVGLLLAATAVAAARPELLARMLRPLPPALGRLSTFAAGWSRALGRARSPRVLAGGFALALVMRGTEALGMILVQLALGVSIPFTATLVVLASVAIATMLPLAPANVGVYEGSAFLAYRWAGVDPESALALAVLQHLAYLAAMGGAGWAAVTLGVARSTGLAARHPSASS